MRPSEPSRPVGRRTEKWPARLASKASCSSVRVLGRGPLEAAPRRSEDRVRPLAVVAADYISAVMARSPSRDVQSGRGSANHYVRRLLKGCPRYVLTLPPARATNVIRPERLRFFFDKPGNTYMQWL